MTPKDSPGEETQVHQSGIVSVNDRGSGGSNPLGKVFFIVGVVGLATVAGFYGYNHYRAAQSAKAAAAQQSARNEAKPARAGMTRDFDKDAAAREASSAPPVPGTALAGRGPCSDGSAGVPAVRPDGQPFTSAQGAVMRVCPDGHVIVPDIEGGAAAPIAVATNASAGAPKPSRYAGEALLSSSGTPGGGVAPPGRAAGVESDIGAQAENLAATVQRGMAGSGFPGAGAAPSTPSAPAAAATLGAQLTPSSTPMVEAAMIGDRNMIIPKGRSLECGLSMRLVSDLAGLASCILSQNVYSDNGKVLLLERGSEAVGEYSAGMAQGQRRLFVLWTRIKTPTGVVINLNSPGADDLGTSGLPGQVNNHWWQRLGAAALLTLVQDAIAYKTAQASNSGSGSLAVYQNTSQTTNDMAETILASTLNIKPTLYKTQGDRSTIYVARDLDFSAVYALKLR
jgi:type IV secretion system protein VirB10